VRSGSVASLKPGFVGAGFPAIAASRRGRLGVGPERAAGLRFSSCVADTAAVLDTLDTLDGAPVLVGTASAAWRPSGSPGSRPGEDRIVSPRLARKTARHYGAEPRLYPGHGHWITQEPGWQAIADDIIGWLSSNPR
jgi:hypothetical protein